MYSKREDIKSMKHGIWVTNQFVRTGEKRGKDDLQYPSLNTETATANCGKKRKTIVYGEKKMYMLQIPFV